jgi:secretion/DNA translocation related TadE-like protein
MLVVLMVGLVSAMGAAVAASQHHVDGAADLVALSSARRLSDGEDPCATAAAVAAANDVELDDCQVDGLNVVVEVSDRMALPFDLDATLTGQARVGPSGISGR